MLYRALLRSARERLADLRRSRAFPRSSRVRIWLRLIAAAARDGGTALADGDIVVVTSKIVSKAEGRTIELADVDPSPFAIEWSTKWDKDPAVTEVVLREAKRIVRQSGPVLITETQHGFVCANSGVDQSSSGAHWAAGAAADRIPMRSARRIRAGLRVARRRCCRHHLRHLRSGVARRPDRHRHRHRRDAADPQLHRPVRPARARVQGAGRVPRRRTGRCRGTGQGQHLAHAGRGDPRAARGSATTQRRLPRCCATRAAICSDRRMAEQIRVERRIHCRAARTCTTWSATCHEWASGRRRTPAAHGSTAPPGRSSVLVSRVRTSRELAKWSTNVVVTVAEPGKRFSLRRDASVRSRSPTGTTASSRTARRARSSRRGPIIASRWSGTVVSWLIGVRDRPDRNRQEHGRDAGQAGGSSRSLISRLRRRSSSTRRRCRRRALHCA